MPFCSNCGRKLEDNETCSCQTQQNSNFNQTPPPPPINVQPGYQRYDHLGRPLYTPRGQPIMYNEQGQTIIVGQPPKKSNTGCIIALVTAIFILLIIGAVLAAILIPSMLGFVKKSKIAGANANTKIIAHAVSGALEEMKENGTIINGTYIICSDRSNNVLLNVSETFNESALYTTASDYTDLINNKDWFVVVENGVVTYAAYEEHVNNNDYIGTYPNPTDSRGSVAAYNGYRMDDADISDLYKIALENIRTKTMLE